MENLLVENSELKRIVILGAGFGGFTLAKKLINTNFQVVLIDRNNFHQFQPLFYQVAMAGLEPSSIVFPLRKAFQKCENVIIRVAEVEGIDTERNKVQTDMGYISYDYLVIATGATTNFFGNQEIASNTYGLKSVSEALSIRNNLFNDFEEALTTHKYEDRQSLIDIAIVGGGPTGVELAGALAEMKRYILPKDYKELDASEVDIYLIQAADKLLPGMSEKSSMKSFDFLTKLGVKIMLNTRVTGIKNGIIETEDGSTIVAEKVIWAAGIKGDLVDGFAEAVITPRSTLKINSKLEIIGLDNVYAIGDIAHCESEEHPRGYPQVAQVAIQMAQYLHKVFTKEYAKDFKYRDLGSMATIGRNRAVADLPFGRMSGFFAWILWLFVHLASLIGFKNKLFVLINWMWNYLTYDQSLRLIIRPHNKAKNKTT